MRTWSGSSTRRWSVTARRRCALWRMRRCTGCWSIGRRRCRGWASIWCCLRGCRWMSRTMSIRWSCWRGRGVGRGLVAELSVLSVDDGRRVVVVLSRQVAGAVAGALHLADKHLATEREAGRGGHLSPEVKALTRQLLDVVSGSDPVVPGRDTPCVPAGSVDLLLLRGALLDVSEVEAAERLGVSPRRVRQLVGAGRLVRSAPGRVLAVGVEVLWAARERRVRRLTDVAASEITRRGSVIPWRVAGDVGAVEVPASPASRL